MLNGHCVGNFVLVGGRKILKGRVYSEFGLLGGINVLVVQVSLY